MAKGLVRTSIQAATVTAVYRHACSDAVAAANAQNWAECTRLMGMAREIERAYPGVSARARFGIKPEHIRIN